MVLRSTLPTGAPVAAGVMTLAGFRHYEKCWSGKWDQLYPWTLAPEPTGRLSVCGRPAVSFSNPFFPPKSCSESFNSSPLLFKGEGHARASTRRKQKLLPGRLWLRGRASDSVWAQVVTRGADTEPRVCGGLSSWPSAPPAYAHVRAVSQIRKYGKNEWKLLSTQGGRWRVFKV